MLGLTTASLLKGETVEADAFQLTYLYGLKSLQSSACVWITRSNKQTNKH